jgi:hypothetical protein
MGNMELFPDNKRKIMKSSMIDGLQFSFYQLDALLWTRTEIT